MKSAGKRRHALGLFRPGKRVPDGDGGFTQSWDPLSPATAFAAIEPATARNMERFAANTVIASTTHIVTLPYQSDMNTRCRLTFGARIFNVVGLQDPDERHIELILACAEVLS